MVSIGIDGSFEGENGDYRAFTGIALPGSQAKLVTLVAEASPVPVVVVVSGSSVDLSPIKAIPKVGAILWVGYGGEAAGQALADVLYGAYNPSGRLTTTFCERALRAVSSFFAALLACLSLLDSGVFVH